MSTTSYINRIFGRDESGVNEATVSASARRKVETFVAGEAIAVGDFVALNFAETADGEKGLVVKKADSSNTDIICVVGVAIEAATTDETSSDSGSTNDRTKLIKVVVAGLVDQANVDGSVVKGDRLVASSTAGRAATAPSFRTDLGDGTGTTTGTVEQAPQIIGIACEADAANKALVYLFPQVP
jgi:hypothetical protein